MATRPSPSKPKPRKTLTGARQVAAESYLTRALANLVQLAELLEDAKWPPGLVVAAGVRADLTRIRNTALGPVVALPPEMRGDRPTVVLGVAGPAFVSLARVAGALVMRFGRAGALLVAKGAGRAWQAVKGLPPMPLAPMPGVPGAPVPPGAARAAAVKLAEAAKKLAGLALGLWAAKEVTDRAIDAAAPVLAKPVGTALGWIVGGAVVAGGFYLVATRRRKPQRT